MIEEKVVNKLIQNKETISTMESCTGGFLASTITCVDGSSKVFNFGAVTYTNEYKIKMGVDAKVIEKYTVYSIETAHEMSKSICEFTKSTYGVGITGKINRVDENNLYGNNNEVFASIYNSKNKTYTDIKITVPNLKRKEVKEIIINDVLNKLIEIL